MTIWKAQELALFNAFVQREKNFAKQGLAPKKVLNAAKVFKLHSRIDKLILELRHQIIMLSVIGDFVAIRSHIKLYIITWHTLSDVTADIINEVYDLGIAEKDLNLTMILRNRHIQSGPLPIIFKKYKETVRFDYYAKHRNDIIHRGFLPDDELDAVYGAFITASLQNSSEYQALKLQIHSLPIGKNEDVIASRKSLEHYLLQKAAELTKHLDSTEEMLVEIVLHLSECVLMKND